MNGSASFENCVASGCLYCEFLEAYERKGILLWIRSLQWLLLYTNYVPLEEY